MRGGLSVVRSPRIAPQMRRRCGRRASLATVLRFHSWRRRRAGGATTFRLPMVRQGSEGLLRDRVRRTSRGADRHQPGSYTRPPAAVGKFSLSTVARLLTVVQAVGWRRIAAGSIRLVTNQVTKTTARAYVAVGRRRLAGALGLLDHDWPLCSAAACWPARARDAARAARHAEVAQLSDSSARRSAGGSCCGDAAQTRAFNPQPGRLRRAETGPKQAPSR